MSIFKALPHPDGPTAVHLRTLCFIFHQQDVLLIFRQRPPDAGMWNAIGGKVDRGEDPLEAAQREVMEEAGIRPSLEFRGISTVVVRSTGEHWVIFLFSAQVDEPAVVASPEGPLRWVGPGEIEAPTVLPDIPMLVNHMRRPGVVLAKFTNETPDPGTLETLSIRVARYGDG